MEIFWVFIGFIISFLLGGLVGYSFDEIEAPWWISYPVGFFMGAIVYFVMHGLGLL